jgi:hypothetical protein
MKLKSQNISRDKRKINPVFLLDTVNTIQKRMSFLKKYAVSYYQSLSISLFKLAGINKQQIIQ